MKNLVLFTVLAAFGASIGGNRAPDGSEIQIDLPGDLHRKNTTSRGQGCCVWTSIHHSALWQNVAAYVDAPKWIQEKNIAGGAHSGSVERYLPMMAKERGYTDPPQFINYEGNDLELLKLATRSGRLPAITYAISPTGRYGGKRIAHMTNLVAGGVGHGPDGRGWWVVQDSNFPGDSQYEWMSEAEFKKAWTAMGGGWCVIVIQAGPPTPPSN